MIPPRNPFATCITTARCRHMAWTPRRFLPVAVAGRMNRQRQQEAKADLQAVKPEEPDCEYRVLTVRRCSWSDGPLKTDKNRVVKYPS